MKIAVMPGDGVGKEVIAEGLKVLRVAAYGVLIPDAEMRAAIIAGRDVALRQHPLPEGSRDISDDIERLRREGVVTDEAARAALDTLL